LLSAWLRVTVDARDG